MAFGDSGLTSEILRYPHLATWNRPGRTNDTRPYPVPEYGPVEDGDDFDPDARTVDLRKIDHRTDEHECAWSTIYGMCLGMDASLPNGPFPDFTIKEPFALEDVDEEDIAEADIDYTVIGMDAISPFPQTFVLTDADGEFDRFEGKGMTFAAVRTRISSKVSERLAGQGRWNVRMKLGGHEIGVTYEIEG